MSNTTESTYLRFTGTALDPGRVVLNKILNENDIEVSVRKTISQVVSPSASVSRWEVKVGKLNDFGGALAEEDINALKEGFLAYVSERHDRTGYPSLNWKFTAGATSVTGTVALSYSPRKLGIKRQSTKISVLVDDVEKTSNIQGVWATLSTLKASIAADNADNYWQGFNAFNVVNKALPSACYGLDGQGSDTVVSPKRIAASVKFMEITGTEEAHEVKQREAHAYFRPPQGLTSMHSGFEVNWKSYENGGTTPVETVSAVQYEGDIQNWKNVQGRRIQHELVPNMSWWRLVGVDCHYWSEDKKNLPKGPDDTKEADYQEELATDLVIRAGRRDWTVDKATGATISALTTKTVVTGPDSDSDGAILLGTGHQVYASSSTLYSALTDYTVLFWVKTPTYSYPVLKLTGTNEWTAQFTNATTLSVCSQSFTTPNIADGAWHFVAVIRSSNAVSVYVDKVLKGTATNSTSYGGTGFSIQNSGAYTGEVRVYDEAKTTAELDYYYEDVINNQGEKVHST